MYNQSCSNLSSPIFETKHYNDTKHYNSTANFAFTKTVCEQASKGKFEYAGRADKTVKLLCPSGLRISSAFYGRATCANSLCYSPDFTNCGNTTCTGNSSCTCAIDSAIALAKVKAACESKTSCQLEASNTFFGTDPRKGESKYLTVTYECPEKHTGYQQYT